MAKPTDATADPVNGTLVQEVDAQGNRVPGGFLHGEAFTTVQWNTRNATDASACPVWISTVVMSKTLDGAKLGAKLAPQDPAVDLSSSSTSMNVTALLVDEHGKQIGQKTYKNSLVRAISGQLAADGMAIATELWFSEAPVAEIIANAATPAIKANLMTMANRCKQEFAGGGNPGGPSGSGNPG